MRTSLNNLRDIERYVEGLMQPGEEVLFEGRLQGNPVLRTNLFLYKKVMALIRMYHRKKLKMELEEVHQRLFGDPLKVTFRERILKIFSDN